ncbi:hypothetical protein Amet_2260 [Alkaliphilus metalliredigens QYMF]|uniref:Uncharacterized protein n=1 Tax=Alkaliphilus metalliredigens (strain QYMF) TaxID=293826 RepID=A6TQF0_ALKMQ|nr:hypothetical protein [Alkaliphilus metalliredigens]ABR48418.1 hypothetical protein Amet_2260 [Alkaliphilus metalliredigens QYMF]
MALEFDFDRLKDVYTEATNSYEKILIFESQVGKGRYLFMMFVSEEDEESRDLLFLYLRNTNRILNIKMYGNHLKGTFKVYLRENQVEYMTDELQLGNGNGHFSFVNFLNELNDSIPLSIERERKIHTMRKNNSIMKELGAIDESEKKVLIGERRLSVGTPKDKTLRKLYSYTNSSVGEVDKLIVCLKRFNITVAWTTEDRKSEAKSIREILNAIDQ